MIRQALLAILLVAPCLAQAQFAVPDTAAPDGAALFKRQCATCHTLNASEPTRQGPILTGVYGRKVGSVQGYHYTPGYQTSNLVWNEENLDKYLTNPQAMLPGSTMVYRQSNSEIRHKIIDFLKDQH
jgi:cytochrome c